MTVRPCGEAVDVRVSDCRGRALFVVGEEGCGVEAGPLGVAFGGEGVDVVEVRLEGEGCAGG